MQAVISGSMLGLVLGLVAAGASSAHATSPCVEYVEFRATLAHVRSTVDGSPTTAAVPSLNVFLGRRQSVHDMRGGDGGRSFGFRISDSESP